MDAASLNPTDLLTIAGATVAAVVVTQFAKMMFNLSRKWIRIVALLTGLAVVVVAYVSVNTDLTVLGVLLAVIVGMQAGMAANAAFDTARKGLDYQTARPPSG